MTIRYILLTSAFYFIFQCGVLAQADYTLINDAVAIAGCHCYQLTADVGGQGGGVYQNHAINLNNSFDYIFSIFLGSNPNGADGMCFILTNNITAIGVTGGGLGYSGLAGNSLAVEYDTYQNGWDPDNHHMAIEYGGQVMHPTGTLVGPVDGIPGGLPMDNNAWHTTEIVWDVNNQTYKVYFDGVLRLTYTGNIVANYFAGNPVVNWGWSGSTGGDENTQRFCVLSTSNWIAGANYQSCDSLMQFTDISTANVDSVQSWRWNFGDPGSGTADTSSLQNPSHYFSDTGVFTVTLIITDIAGCPDTFSHTVTIVSPITMAPTLTEPLCNGGHNGEITLSTSGGFGVGAGYGGYTYTWSNTGAGTTNTDASLPTGTYDVTCTDGVCTSTASYNLAQPPVLTAMTTPVDTAVCMGDSVHITAALTTGTGTGYAWSNLANTATISVSPAGNTTYTVTVTNANNCTATASSTVTINPPPTASITPPGTSICLGNSAILTAGTETGYLWSNGISTAADTVSPAVNTTYTVTVTNANGCTASTLVTVTVNPLPAATVNSDTICNGASATLTASPAGDSYAWSTAATTAAISISPNTDTSYTVTVTDANNCSAAATGTVIVYSLPPAVISPPSIQICHGNSAILTTSGGTYIWSNGISTAADTVSPSANTTYFVTVTNANNCSATASAAVTVNPLPVPSVNPSPAQICFGDSVTLTASPPGISYAWSTTANTVAITVSPIVTTTFTVTVTDANNCSATTSDVVTVHTLPIPSISPSPTRICIGNSATLTASPPGISYAWSTAANTQAITVSPLVTSAYSVTVTDGNSCSAAIADTVTVNPLPIATVTPPTGTICFGTSTTLTAGGGISYLWNTGANTAADNVSPVADSTYTVTVTDANSCSSSTTATVTVNPLPSPTVNPSAVQICEGDSTTLTALPTGNSYLWSTSATTATITVFPTITTTYTLTATNAFNCTASNSSTVTVNPLPATHINPDPAQICFGGVITLTALPAGISYAWSTSATSNTITVFPAVTTSYTLTATDGNGCSAAFTDTVAVNPLPAPVALPTSVAICSGTSTTLTASGGSSYQWSNGTNTAANTVSPFAYTIYTVTVSNVFTCTATASDTVTVYSLPTAVINPPSVEICQGASSTLTGSALGNGGFTFLWSANASSAISAAITVTPASTATYTLTVTDINSCTNSTSATVTVDPTMVLSPVITDESCFEASDGSIDMGVSSGETPYTFAWSNLATTGTVIGLDTGTYTVVVTDNAGCTATATGHITEPPLLTISGTYTNPLCATLGNDGTITIHPGGGTTPYQFAWSNNATLQNLTEVGPGQYSVIVTDADKCIIRDTFTLAYIYDFTVQATPAVTIDMGQDTIIAYTLSGDTSPVTATWSPSASLSCISCQAPVATPGETTTYRIEIANTAGCIATDTVTVYVFPDYGFYIPNAFTPNGDGINDYWQAYGRKNTWILCEVAVYDRWGEKVFESSDLDFQWDGKFRGVPVAPGDYVYTFKVVFENDHTISDKGGITVIR